MVIIMKVTLDLLEIHQVESLIRLGEMKKTENNIFYLKLKDDK